MRNLLLCLLACLLVTPAAIGKEARKMANLMISSSAFADKAEIPSRFTCDGQDVSPPLAFEAVPPGTKSLALIMDDPDAPGGTWVHWVAWNIPPQTRDIKENSLPTGTSQGLNDWKRNRYGGPCPPSGIHRYFFKLYALDTTLNLPPATTKTDLERAMEGHLLGQGQLMGTYRRR